MKKLVITIREDGSAKLYKEEWEGTKLKPVLKSSSLLERFNVYNDDVTVIIKRNQPNFVAFGKRQQFTPKITPFKFKKDGL